MMRLPSVGRSRTVQIVFAAVDSLLAQPIGEGEKRETGKECLEAHHVGQCEHRKRGDEHRPDAEDDGDDPAQDQPPAAMRFFKLKARD